jgi:hypothetical protein
MSNAHQRAYPDEDAQHIGAARSSVEIASRGLQDEIDLFREWAGLERRIRNRCIGRAHQGMTVPRNGEHHPAIGRVRNHDGAVAWKEGAIEDQVYA